MPATSIRLPDDIKALVGEVAERAGKTPHAYLLEVVAERVKADAARDEFEAVAEERWQRYLRDGKTIPFDEMRQYLLDRAAGRKVKAPRARKLKG
jgi:predicted transcriptional regulator